MLLQSYLRCLRAELRACIQQARNAAQQLAASATEQQQQGLKQHSAGHTAAQDHSQQSQVHQASSRACVQPFSRHVPSTSYWHCNIQEPGLHQHARAWHAVISQHGHEPSAGAIWQHRPQQAQDATACWLHMQSHSHRHSDSMACSSLPCLLSHQHKLLLPHHAAWSQPQQQQFRHYKSLKKSMRPLNVRASKLAIAPYVQQRRSKRQRRELNRLKRAPIIDTALPPVPEVPVPTELRRIGRITGEYRLELQPAFAVVQLQGTQFKVTVDDIVFVNHIRDVAVNEMVALDRVMLVGSRDTTVIGRPWLANACVIAAVEEHFKDGIVHVYKFKKRNRYRKYHQHQQALTALRILRVVADTSAEDAQLALQQQVPHVLYPDARRDSTCAEADNTAPVSSDSEDDAPSQAVPAAATAT